MAGTGTRQRRRSAERRDENLRQAVAKVAEAGVLDPIATARKIQGLEAAFLGSRLTVHALLKRFAGLGVEVVLEEAEITGAEKSGEKLYIGPGRRGRTHLRVDPPA